MSDNQFHYGTDFTSVRVHAAPGGNSSISLGWSEPEPPRVQRSRQPEDEEEEERKRKLEEQQKKQKIEEERKQIEAANQSRVRHPPGGASSISFG